MLPHLNHKVFQKLVRDIKVIELAMGSSDKTVQESEKPIYKKLAKSIVSQTNILSGKPITLEMLTTKGPGTGISPMKMQDLIGKITNRDISKDEILKEEDIIWNP